MPNRHFNIPTKLSFGSIEQTKIHPKQDLKTSNLTPSSRFSKDRFQSTGFTSTIKNGGHDSKQMYESSPRNSWYGNFWKVFNYVLIHLTFYFSEWLLPSISLLSFWPCSLRDHASWYPYADVYRWASRTFSCWTKQPRHPLRTITQLSFSDLSS